MSGRLTASLAGALIALLPWQPVWASVPRQLLTLGVGSAGTGFPTGAVSCWNLDEASGTRNDAIGTNHLTDNNTVTQAAGKVGNAAQFTAANSEYLSRASNATLQTGDIDFTVAAWVYLDSKATSRYIMAKGGAGLTLEYQLYYHQASDRLRFEIFDVAVNSVGVADAVEIGSPSTGTWYFIVAWHDAAANTVSIQVNNGTVSSAATTGTITADVQHFVIGNNGFGDNLFFDGRVDVAAFWKRVLTSAERTALYNGGNGRACGS